MAQRPLRRITLHRARALSRAEQLSDDRHYAWLDDARLARWLRVRTLNARARGDHRIALSPEMALELARRLEAMVTP
jgi:hypothetical protein